MQQEPRDGDAQSRDGIVMLGLPMKVDVYDSAQNAFVQEWLTKWETQNTTKRNIATFYDLPENHPAVESLWRREQKDSIIQGAIEEIQGTYDYEDHDARKEHFTKRYPDILVTKVTRIGDEDRVQVEGKDLSGRKVWISLEFGAFPVVLKLGGSVGYQR